jgi:hypothetical protein
VRREQVSIVMPAMAPFIRMVKIMPRRPSHRKGLPNRGGDPAGPGENTHREATFPPMSLPSP